MKKSALLLLTLLIAVDIFACTSAIFTGKATKDGRPLMWKNRDTGELNNRLEYFKGAKYSFVGLVNSPSKGGEVWAGNNEVGFCIMNTASYNIDLEEDRKCDKDGEGVLMYNALSVCKNLKDFEYFLDTMKKPAPIEANFGVIDAEGGAAYYEVNSRTWVKRDANDPTLAPNGYLIVTNFSFTGRKDEGMGYIRYESATKIIYNAYEQGVKFTPKWIMDNLSRSFYNSLIDTDLRYSNIMDNTNGWFIDQDFISRKSTSAISIFQGVKPKEDAKNTIYWCALGYGPLSVMMPVITKYQEDIPYIMKRSDIYEGNSPLCDWALGLKSNVFSISRGNGGRYFNFSQLFNAEGTGYTQQLSVTERVILSESEPIIELLRQNKLTKKDIEVFNSKISSIAEKGYSKIMESEHPQIGILR